MKHLSPGKALLQICVIDIIYIRTKTSRSGRQKNHSLSVIASLFNHRAWYERSIISLKTVLLDYRILYSKFAASRMNHCAFASLIIYLYHIRLHCVGIIVFGILEVYKIKLDISSAKVKSQSAIQTGLALGMRAFTLHPISKSPKFNKHWLWEIHKSWRRS